MITRSHTPGPASAPETTPVKENITPVTPVVLAPPTVE